MKGNTFSLLILCYHGTKPIFPALIIARYTYSIPAAGREALYLSFYREVHSAVLTLLFLPQSL